ncbi:MAG: hypothetical protein NC231_04385 [Bacillus sp. (in: Bacteria)]|nr:hypothetical protein [Bacillus sp. (in: firmicutes)]MCM1425300.1 hypothetical protein [Eubacterium sp.]
MENDIKVIEKIRKNNKNYSIYQFSSNNISNTKRNCAGFIHGGLLACLPSIMDAGKLLCSDTLRKRNITCSSRDAHTIGPDGQGVYFRFVPQNITSQCMINSFTGPGKSGGFFMYMPVENAVNLSFLSASIGDYKYDSSTSQSTNGINKIVSELRYKSYINNSEIIFYKEVPISRITAIYIKCQHISYSTDIDSQLENMGYKKIHTIQANPNSTRYKLFVNSDMATAPYPAIETPESIASTPSRSAVRAK